MFSQFDSNILQFRQWLNFLCQNDLIFFFLCIIACRHNCSEVDDETPQAINQSTNQDLGFSIYMGIDTYISLTQWNLSIK